MGMRVRLKASYVIPANFSTETKALLTAMKTYGMIMADNGSNWFVSGAPDDRWNNDALTSELSQVKGSDFRGRAHGGAGHRLTPGRTRVARRGDNRGCDCRPRSRPSYKPYWAKRFGPAPFLPMSRAEMDALGWDSCDVIVVTGDATSTTRASAWP